MDFKSLMSAQIAKSKPPASSSSSFIKDSSSATTASAPSSKYQRRADAERERQAAYKAEQDRLERERLERAAKKRKLEEEEAERYAVREEKKRRLAEESRLRREEEENEEERARRKRLGLPELRIDGDEVEREEEVEIEDEELKGKLREFGVREEVEEGETHEARLARYYRVKRRRAREKKWFSGPIPTTIEPLPADELILPEKAPSVEDSEAYIKVHRQISSYLNFVLTEWGAALRGRNEEDAQSSAGVTASNNYKIALEDLKPLMRRLEAGYHSPPTTIPSNGAGRPIASLRKDNKETPSNVYQPLPHKALLVPLIEILHLTQKRHYRDAVDSYLRLSIGKAAWPIGVTMVGIHERSAREKLHEDGKGKDDVAQIMSDETTRKWLQSLKRLVWDLGQLMG
ncbi:hypothetical protein LTS08_007706 [Lithohypha guttulata]|uniref:uncharacterized protein n=1 Tax=Lithohypha guttulata TaxID=1690604 RepID=UPI002DDFD9B4|nr:hypothetical protein LTR51_008499 [Lithohypha guttulata]KAK5096450.1 hypothetical protein LTS08_007706 [Lithohypha guttulata]